MAVSTPAFPSIPGEDAKASSLSSPSRYMGFFHPSSLPPNLSRPTTMADRKARRRAQNRESQKAFRKRKAEQEDQMNKRYSEMSMRCERLQEENDHLRQLLNRNKQQEPSTTAVDSPRSSPTWQEASGLVGDATDTGQSASPLSIGCPLTPKSALALNANALLQAGTAMTFEGSSSIAKPEPGTDTPLERAPHLATPDRSATQANLVNCLGLSLVSGGGGLQPDVPTYLDEQYDALSNINFDALNQQYGIGQNTAGSASALTPEPFVQDEAKTNASPVSSQGQHVQCLPTIARRRGHTLPSLGFL